MDATATYILSNRLPMGSGGAATLIASKIKRGDRDHDALPLLQRDFIERAKEIARLELRLDKLYQDLNGIGAARYCRW